MISLASSKYIYHEEPGIVFLYGACLDVMRSMSDNSVDSIVTDPPYGISFMGKKWDYKVPSVEEWAEALRVLKPGGHLIAFGGSRTYHRVVVNIEDAGFEIRDQIMWLYGYGFPKSLDVSKAIDKRGGSQVAWFGPWLRNWREENNITQKQVSALFPSKTGGLTGCVANWELGFNMPTPEQFNLIRDTFNLPFNSIEEAERKVTGNKSTNLTPYQNIGGENKSGDIDITSPASESAQQWDGWGTALKPAHEPICVARKPLSGTVAENVLEHGTGGLNIDACRIEGPPWEWGTQTDIKGSGYGSKRPSNGDVHAKNLESDPKGRFPANLILDPDAGAMLDMQSGELINGGQNYKGRKQTSIFGNENIMPTNYAGDSGGASRFFYCAKASKEDRDEGLEGMEAIFSPTMGNGIGGKEHDPETATPKLNHHPTVKPTALMQYLVRLVTPPGGTILDPFMGSGSTGKAAVRERFNFIGIDNDKEYLPISKARILGAGQVELL